MDNFKKRMERKYTDLASSSKRDILRKLLAVKDNLERALHYGETSESGEGIMEGVKLTQYQLNQLLNQEGVREIEAQGKPFDPRLEEAIQSVDDPSVPDHTVVQVVRKGYVFEAAPKYNLLGDSKLGEDVFASPAVADGKLYIRGAKHLFCIGERK